MLPSEVLTDQQMVLFLLERTLGTIGLVAIKKNHSKSEANRHIAIAEFVVKWIREEHWIFYYDEISAFKKENTFVGKLAEEHDWNVRAFYEAAKP